MIAGVDMLRRLKNALGGDAKRDARKGSGEDEMQERASTYVPVPFVPLTVTAASSLPVGRVDECADCPNCIIRKQVGVLLERIGGNPAEDVALILEAARITEQAQETAREKNQTFSKDNREIIERLEAIKVAKAAEISAAPVVVAQVARGSTVVAPPRRRNIDSNGWVASEDNRRLLRTDSKISL